jgi:hypothetical protein
MNEVAPEYLQRLTEMEPELLEGGSDAFEPSDFEDNDEGSAGNDE